MPLVLYVISSLYVYTVINFPLLDLLFDVVSCDSLSAITYYVCLN